MDRQTRVTTQLAQSDNGIRVEIYASSAGGQLVPPCGGKHRRDTRGWSRRRLRVPIGSETEIVLPDDAVDHPGYRIHPVMLDAALHCLAAAMRS